MPKHLYLALALAFPAAASAGELVYQPVNPSFGGNPLNGPNLLNSANSQNKLTTDPKSGRIVGEAQAMKYWAREYAPKWAPTV